MTFNFGKAIISAIAVSALLGCSPNDTVLSNLRKNWALLDTIPSEQLTESLKASVIPSNFFDTFPGPRGGIAILDSDMKTIAIVNYVASSQAYLIVLCQVNKDDSRQVKDVVVGRLGPREKILSESGRLNDHRIEHLIVRTSDTLAGERIEAYDNVYIFDTTTLTIQDVRDERPIVYNEAG